MSNFTMPKRFTLPAGTGVKVDGQRFELIESTQALTVEQHRRELTAVLL